MVIPEQPASSWGNVWFIAVATLVIFLIFAGGAAEFLVYYAGITASRGKKITQVLNPPRPNRLAIHQVNPAPKPARLAIPAVMPPAAKTHSATATRPTTVLSPASRPGGATPPLPAPAATFALPRPISLLAADPSANADLITSHKVKVAIIQGVHFLLRREDPKRFWDRQSSWAQSNEHGGQTALVMEALIDINESLHLPELYSFSPRMKSALNYLAALQTKATYATSFQAQALALLPNVGRKKYMAALNRDRRYLFRAMIPAGDFTYTWRRYRGFSWDNSNTQYGVLGLWACAHAGLEVLTSQWRLLASHWRNTQHIDGSWGYTQDHRNPQSFTPAGVASLFICDEFTNAADLNIHPHPDPNIVRGLHWLDANFDPTEKNQYVMYGYERVGLAGGIKYFGTQNWYRDFVRTLLATQHANGSWRAHFIAPRNGGRIIGTAYSLLTLDRGLNPVFINKLQYSPHFYGQWNARPRDAANITSYLSHEMETPLNWQVISATAPVNQWLDSPLLLITGHKNPHFSTTVLKKLRDYVNAGGMVFCSCDGHSRRFERAMIQAGQACVGGKAQFQPVGANSALLTMQPWFHINTPLLALSNGVRYLWIISPEDMAGVWQSRLHTHKQPWEMPLNFYLYATGKGFLANRLHSLTVPPPQQSPRRSIAIGLLKFSGNWNPEPGAWPRLAALLATYDRSGLTLSTVSARDLNGRIAKSMPLIHLTGVGAISFSAADLARLRSYLHAGGMLFADSAGGKTAFTDSCNLLVQSLYPNAKLRHIPITSRIITGRMPGGINASTVRYRRFGGELDNSHKTAQLFGIRRHHRWVIVLSSQDITSGLLGTHTWGVRGYSPTSAQALASNVIMYAGR
jgi:hypothetical protein